MPRKKSKRSISFVPKHNRVDGQCCESESIAISLEELEAIRLSDLLFYDQSKAADEMGISRGTLQRILKSAQEKVAKSILLGVTLDFTKGNSVEKEQTLGMSNPLTLAIPLVNGQVSKHFGKSDQFFIATIQEGKIIHSISVENDWHERAVQSFSLLSHGVSIVLAQHMGERAKEVLAAYGINVHFVNSVSPDDIITEFISTILQPE
ncbi:MULTISPECIES: DUF134 domain-containing protein [unclassified Fusibacter]|uniref:DUF134 domain-containing protein n=1 Tax=unclassified Fusibacter TaxID=2624464 RepID=UPI0010107098|nr:MULTISPECIES: DUF134 domain-containing protein [unclassified Fusibacter]MCK8061112.1 DUF134 domain-containing protein [Fusibacter sp. A2]NPE23352.1 DUF134 domain-containing protein [Fusibacter sp. A1]RXV59397.1 DUF134 domain-containing protein [Fusibacter sp. A1]